jgi:type I restriction enzyme S subunit
MSWKIGKLSDVAFFIMGQSPPSSSYIDSDKSNGLPLFQGKAEFRHIHPIPTRWCTNPTKIAEPTDILLSVRAPVGPTNIADQHCCIGRGLAAIRCKQEKAEYKYVYWFLKSIESSISELGQGSTFKAITKSTIEGIKIPLPPLEEQRRIAAILDKVDAVRQKRKEAIALTEELLRSAFLEMFGNPVTNQKGWKKIKLADAVDLVNGRAFKPSEWTTQGLPIIRIQNLKSPDAKYNHYKGHFQEKFRVKPGDLLLSWSGQLVSFGVFIWQGSEGVLNQHIFNVRPRMPFELEYLEFALGSVVEMSKSKFHGIEMKHLTKEELNSQTVLYPPIQLQTEFALKIRHLRGMKDKQNSQQCNLDNFFNSLLQRAFRGEL